MRVGLRGFTGLFWQGAIDGCGIAAETISQKTGNPANRGDADAGEIVNSPVGQAFLQELDCLPAIYQRLQFGWRTQVAEKISAFRRVFHADNCCEQGVLGPGSTDLGVVWIWFDSAGSGIYFISRE